MHSKKNNVQTNPLRDGDWDGVGEHWGAPGLQLVARAHDNDSTPVRPEAFIRTERSDIMYGSFRALMKNVHAPGTYLSFAWVSSNRSHASSTQMIGFNIPPAHNSTVTFYTGNVEVADRCSGTGVSLLDAHVHTISGDDSRMHEYRFDWTPSRMDFYIDGHWLSSSKGIQPRRGGSVEISLWSNGESKLGPVLQQEEVITVSYAKLYFNTTSPDTTVGKKWQDHTCQAWDLNDNTEPIPSEFFDESNPGKTFFFSKAVTHDNKALEHTDSALHFEDPVNWTENASAQQHSSLFLVAVMSTLAGLVALMV
ncbi:hypothetical protein AMS68_000498 [Peltaster fructicola]|uniref:GH16 domain-containing protein n=1 Tax=Peltaster fructicola TaxID=286661 RepID=A0A6H0XK16_9PEZI|nr:hypothetical protein AMS68_000498 [Peltaster fructicola]